MWYSTKPIRAFRLPKNEHEQINNDLLCMLNEKGINKQWVSNQDSFITIKSPLGDQFATWGDWIIENNGFLFCMTNERFCNLTMQHLYSTKHNVVNE